MGRQKRIAVIVASIVVALVVAESGLRWIKGPEGIVQIDNEGTEPIEGLTATLGKTRTRWPDVPPGESLRVRVNGRGRQTLTLAFRQRNNPLNGFDYPDFDAGALAADGSLLVFKIRNNLVTRYQDDAGPTTLLGAALDWLRKRLRMELGLRPDVTTE